MTQTMQGRERPYPRQISGMVVQAGEGLDCADDGLSECCGLLACQGCIQQAVCCIKLLCVAGPACLWMALLVSYSRA